MKLKWFLWFIQKTFLCVIKEAFFPLYPKVILKICYLILQEKVSYLFGAQILFLFCLELDSEIGAEKPC